MVDLGFEAGSQQDLKLLPSNDLSFYRSHRSEEGLRGIKDGDIFLKLLPIGVGRG